VKLRNPQELDRETLYGVAKTLSQLRTLGLLSIVVLDCGIEAQRDIFGDQASTLCEAIDSFSKPGSKLVENIAVSSIEETGSDETLVGDICIEDGGRLRHALEHGLIPIIPALTRPDDISAPRAADANKFVLALTKYVTGSEPELSERGDSHGAAVDISPSGQRIGIVERIIILDPLGALPTPGRSESPLRFVNLEQEFDVLVKQLRDSATGATADKHSLTFAGAIHALNLSLAKEALSLLPPTSSALITDPSAAANTTQATNLARNASFLKHQLAFDFNGMVTTRRKKNPLLHNLLTDKPVLSSSLPGQRVDGKAHDGGTSGMAMTATLVKQGMPLTIFPDPRKGPWTPPSSKSKRLRLTDHCIDLPRLVYLIEDSFGRKLHLDDYLARVNENLAGVIIAGEYEGCAILTWELPEELDDHGDANRDKLVPYLDKFAVLRSRQGSGGVADIVFSAMVGDCFPQGVCWRSRKDNPVNKWYFERSTGTYKLPNSNWSMFWTTPGLHSNHSRLQDYESVCRKTELSWI
jgi:amino-acid N-acetyltransferase